MLNKHVFRLSISLLLFITVAFSSVQPALASSPAPERSQARFEVRFMKRMIYHHAVAVEMSRVCVRRAIHDELRAMCEKMITDQMHEIELMQTWLKDWYDINYRPHIDSQGQRMIAELKRYHKEKFEIRFMRMMIQHHKMAIRMSNTCLNKAYHDELLNLCEMMIETQMAEIAMMRMWLCEWYQRCGDDD